MKLLRKLAPLGPVVVVFVAAIGTVMAETQFALYQRIPWVALALIVAALIWSAVLLRERKSIGAGLALVVTVLVGSAYAWWTLDYSEYDSTRSATVSNGDMVAQLADLSLVDHTGAAQSLLDDRRRTLLVLYRGYW